MIEDISHQKRARNYVPPTPVSFKPGLIGEVVTIQVIPRKLAGSDELTTSLMTKYVGRLTMYMLKEDQETFILDGTNGAPVVVNLNMSIIEVYSHG